LEERGHDIQEKASFTVLVFQGKDLPKEYKSFVYSKWLRTLKYGNDYFKLTDSDSYFNNYERFINILLARPKATIRMAVLSDDRDVCLGWSLIEGDILHYVFVQHEQRNQGIGKSLVPVPINYITHLTKAGMSAWTHNLPNAVFDPFR